jgi:anaerobic magnesium-protoporphyrin IX monomethyl ester cyclase
VGLSVPIQPLDFQSRVVESWKFLEYWFEPDPFKRRYLLGCLWAFVKTTLNKRFYNLSRVKQKGLQTEIEFGFDESKILTTEQMAQLRRDSSADIDFVGTISACGAPNDLPEYQTQLYPHDVIQVAVVEADEQTRFNLQMNLRSQSGIEVASEATNAETGIVLLESIDVDVAVVDGTLPDMDLVKFIRMARKAQANSYVIPSKILVLVSPGNLSVVSDAIAAGADALYLKGAPIEQLANAIKITHCNGMYQDPAIANLLEPVVTTLS